MMVNKKREVNGVGPRTPRRKNGFLAPVFTLIELLVVIAVIGILVSLLLPALKSARDRGKQISCLGNLKQLGVYTGMYIDDFGWLYARRWSSAVGLGLTDSTNWTNYAFDPYYERKNPGYGIGAITKNAHQRCEFACPSIPDGDPDFVNPWTLGHNEAIHSNVGETPKLKGPKYKRPSRLCLLADTKAVMIASPTRVDFRHLNSINVLYIDLHANSRHWNSLPNSRLVTTTHFWKDNDIYDNNPE